MRNKGFWDGFGTISSPFRRHFGKILVTNMAANTFKNVILNWATFWIYFRNGFGIFGISKMNIWRETSFKKFVFT